MRLRTAAALAVLLLAAAAGIALALPGEGGERPAPTRTRADGPRPFAPRHATSARHPPASARTAGEHVNVLAVAPASESRCHRQPPPEPVHLITRRRWLRGVTITEYYSAPERWFTGRRIAAPGLPGRYAADFLYSARGVAMEGDGIDRHGHHVSIASVGAAGWVNLRGRLTEPVCLGKWTKGSPVWLTGGWRNALGAVTFPLSGGGWANGHGVHWGPYGGVTFQPRASRSLRPYHSIAVDPRLIPLGSRVYIPAYRHLGGGWFIAQDTGGAIRGRHLDVYRPSPCCPGDEGRYMTGQRILVIPPG